MSGDKEHLVQKRAYELWEKEGRPHGRDKHHWDQATREMSAPAGASGPAVKTAPVFTASRTPMATAPAITTPATPVKGQKPAKIAAAAINPKRKK